MDLKRIINIYDIIKNKLPSSYPKPKLAFYEDANHLKKVQNIKIGDDKLFAVFDPNDDTIRIPTKNVIDKSDLDIAKILLHECAHAYFGQTFGYSSKKYFDELACDSFARKWVKKILFFLEGNNNSIFDGWTEKEVIYLKNNYQYNSKDNILNNINRSWAAIRSKAALLGLKRDNKSNSGINHLFFSVPYNKENCWVAGFIAADGSISKNSNNIKISISTKDIDILQKIKEKIGYNKNIKTYEHLGKKYSVLSFSSKKMIEDLKKNFSVFSNKSIKHKFPKHIDGVHLSHFMRGYFDGNGSIFFNKKGQATFTVSGSPSFIKYYISVLKKNTNISSGKIYNKKASSGLFRIGGNKNILKIRDFIYSYADDLCLNRKRDIIFSTIINNTSVSKLRPVIKIDLASGNKEFFKSIKFAVDTGQYTYSGISSVCSGARKTHRGFGWEYFKE